MILGWEESIRMDDDDAKNNMVGTDMTPPINYREEKGRAATHPFPSARTSSSLQKQINHLPPEPNR